MNCPYVALEIERRVSGATLYKSPVIFEDRYPSYLAVEVTATATEECLLCGARRRIKCREGQETARTDWSMNGVHR